MAQLNKIYTKSGDAGFTSTSDGTRVFKASNIMCAVGDIDELNAHVGHLIELSNDEVSRQTVLSKIQMDLFDLGARVSAQSPEALSSMPEFSEERTNALERFIDAHTEHQEPLEGFILPRGSKAITQAHICRTVARRAERSLCASGLQVRDKGRVNELKYLNRLSDFFFVFIRFLHRSNDIDEFIWRSE